MSDIIVITDVENQVIEVGGATGPQGPAGTGLDTLTTKGDTLGHNGTTAVRVPVGSNGQVLTANSSATAGITWSTITTTPAWADITGKPAFTDLATSNSTDEDVEITDATRGIILRNANGQRARVTLNNDLQLVRTVLGLLISFFLAVGAYAQTQRTLDLNTNNQVVTGSNATVTFTNTVAAPAVVVSGDTLTIANGPEDDVQIVNDSGDIEFWSAGDSFLQVQGNVPQIVANAPILFGTNAAPTRTNLGIPLATLTNTDNANFLAALFTNAAASNSVWTADGAGGAGFVASRVQVARLTNNVTRTNASDSAASSNNVTGWSVSVDANSVYSIRYNAVITCGAEGAGLWWVWDLASTNAGVPPAQMVARVYRPNLTGSDIFWSGFGGSQMGGSMLQNGANYTSGTTNGVFNGFGVFRTGASNAVMQFRFIQNTASNVTTTLHSNSLVQVEKIWP